MRDGHIHYTGSLPLNYICSLLNKYLKDYPEDVNINDNNFYKKFCKTNHFSVDDLRLGLQNTFTNKHKLNYDKFFEIYKFLQIPTKPRKISEVRYCYDQGTRAILSNLAGLGVTEAVIFAGPTKNITETRFRLCGMIDAINWLGNNNYSIRLTFISSGGGNYVNFDKKSTEDVLDLLLRKKEIGEHINGFDFSGVESILNLDLISYATKRLNEFNNEFFCKYKRKLTISVHASENFVDISEKEYLYIFDKLNRLPINNIGHGIFLWIPNQFVQYKKTTNVDRQKILIEMIKNEKVFEICPSSNVLFSPLNHHRDIPISYFKNIGMNYSINSDNMTILDTNVFTEMDRINR